MLYNIKTGFQGLTRRPMSEIVIMVSSLHALARKGIPFVFTDRHAYLQLASFFPTSRDLIAFRGNYCEIGISNTT
jgi:hypothetical protein